MSENKLKEITEEMLIEALNNPETKKKLDKISEEFFKKQQEELMKPKFMKNECNCCCCRKY